MIFLDLVTVIFFTTSLVKNINWGSFSNPYKEILITEISFFIFIPFLDNQATLAVDIMLNQHANYVKMLSCWVRIFQYMDLLLKKMKFSIKDFFSKCDQIRSFLRSFYYLCTWLTYFINIFKSHF